jgi:hypothetical protein
MAIFRQGVKVGPFDLRLGIPRDKSLDNVDKDPRLRQYANTENQMGRFRAAMAAANGYARTTRFAVRIYPPTNLEHQVNAAQETDTRSGGNYAVRNSTSGKQMSDITTALGRQLNIHCDSVNMPAHDLQTETITQFGPPREMVTGHGFPGTISASFYADSFLRERHFLEMWQKMAVNHVTHKAGYYKDYASGKMQIFQLASDNTQDHPSYGIEATEVYPATVSAIEYNYSGNQIVKINVGFQYKEWHNLAADTIGNVDFSNNKQILPPMKSMDGGLFGKLPPELQRMARGGLNQATTVLNPIGKIFKGKLYPPF